jgi:hypothetical protein
MLIRQDDKPAAVAHKTGPYSSSEAALYGLLFTTLSSVHQHDAVGSLIVIDRKEMHMI